MDRAEFPVELTSPECVAALLDLLAETASDASQIEGIDWDANLKEGWESRLSELHCALKDWQDGAP